MLTTLKCHPNCTWSYAVSVGFQKTSENEICSVVPPWTHLLDAFVWGSKGGLNFPTADKLDVQIFFPGSCANAVRDSSTIHKACVYVSNPCKKSYSIIIHNLLFAAVSTNSLLEFNGSPKSQYAVLVGKPVRWVRLTSTWMHIPHRLPPTTIMRPPVQLIW